MQTMPTRRQFLKLVAPAAAGGVAWLAAARTPAQAGTTKRAKADTAALRVATFQCDLTPPLGHLLYPSLKPLAHIEHPLLAKGIVLDDGRQRCILCAIEWHGLCNATYDLFCRKAAEAAGTDAARAALHAVHLQNAPVADAAALALVRAQAPAVYPDPKFFEEMADRLAAAVKQSVARWQPFDRVGAGEAKVERVASTRRVMGKDGRIRPRWSLVKGEDLPLRDEPEGLIDPLLKTITLARGDKPLVRLHYYACHPQTYFHDPRTTCDFPGMAREALEKKEDVFQVYFTGCAGDVLVGKYNDGTPQCREQLSRRLLAGMEAAITATRFEPAESLQWRGTTVKLPAYAGPGQTTADHRARMSNATLSPTARLDAAVRVTFPARIERPLPVSSLRMGRVRVLALPGECVVDYQLYAQRCAPHDFVAVAAYTDFGPRSVCTDKQYEEGGPEPVDANVGPGCEALLKAAIGRLLQQPGPAAE